MKYKQNLIAAMILVTVTAGVEFNNRYGTFGIASFYGLRFQGKETADGEIFDMNMLTAAHRRLPFNTYVKVTNLLNHKSVIVRINDRGPYISGRIIDLSKEAASKIGMTHRGIVPVKIEVLK